MTAAFFVRDPRGPDNTSWDMERMDRLIARTKTRFRVTDLAFEFGCSVAEIDRILERNSANVWRDRE